MANDRQKRIRDTQKFLNVMGGLTKTQVVVTVALASILGLFTQSFFNLADALVKYYLGKEAATYFPLMIVSSVILGLAFLFFSRRNETEISVLRPQLNVELSKSTRVLVLFLSLPQKPLLDELMKNESDSAEKSEAQHAVYKARLLKTLARIGSDVFANQIEQKTVETLFGPLNWLMPVLAIRHHLLAKPSRLERIIIMPSADTSDKRYFGTHHLDEIFRDYIKDCLKNTHPKVEVDRIADVMNADLKVSIGAKQTTINLALGVPFDSIEAVLEGLYQLIETLRKEGLSDDDMLIDITGGLATNSVAGAIVSILARSRRFQYVDTNTYSVRTFNLTHDAEDLLGDA